MMQSKEQVAIVHDKMFITVLIRDKKFKQFCGDGDQKMRWLTDCAIYKYEISNETKISCGPAYGLKMENGFLCDLNKPINTALCNGSNVLVLLKEEYDVEIEERRKKCNNQNVNLVNNFYDEEGNDDEEEDFSGEEEYNYDENENNEENEEKHYLPKNEGDDNEEYNNYSKKDDDEDNNKG